MGREITFLNVREHQADRDKLLTVLASIGSFTAPAPAPAGPAPAANPGAADLAPAAATGAAGMMGGLAAQPAVLAPAAARPVAAAY